MIEWSGIIERDGITSFSVTLRALPEGSPPLLLSQVAYQAL
ncbi:hypothetical protein THEYE_A1180 [Thermodesulfovibrio yellowstonii DSM 11347]|uniref:Uncharacterized protein n=1 Tax=Thermodesulfovibrio yellowstonii (strain ATCC 51303 / DSM 11347 / YP87) TaxID=289376 RepID=B5YL86_THEYD|nr:hypothetical protein THEYE_A1180 [Thermodesulfovibrio yellowstonii DSM 11347]